MAATAAGGFGENPAGHTASCLVRTQRPCRAGCSGVGRSRKHRKAHLVGSASFLPSQQQRQSVEACSLDRVANVLRGDDNPWRFAAKLKHISVDTISGVESTFDHNAY